ncbi:Aspartate/methionine/tyrosine aminotransferase [Rhizobiales bacterium GAS188]|nr:Aspartate/methionine/tyrosine aminotransferase [Rhizobiales bacterium GAS188]
MRHGQGKTDVKLERPAPSLALAAHDAATSAATTLSPARRAAVAPFIAMEVLSQAGAIEAKGGSVVHMELGEPGAPAPRLAREAAKRAIDQGRIGYTPALGLPPLRERIARHYHDLYGLRLDPTRIAVTTGSSAGFILAFLACFDAGDRVAIASPGYPAYRNILEALGIEPVIIETGPADRWAITPQAILAAHAQKPLKGVLVMSPANPTGVMMGATALAALAETCNAQGLWFVSDEIYHGLTYEGPATSALTSAPQAIVVNSFSKYFCMTGWRIGWLVLPEHLVRPVERLAQNLFISPPYISQVAAEAAFEATAELEAVKAGYAQSRALLLEALPRLGFTELLPVDGAFYAYGNVSRLSNDSVEFCRRALVEAGVAITPGLDFDRERGGNYVRLSFAGSPENVRDGVKRLESWLKHKGRA